MEYLNPKGLIKNPAFSQVVTTEGHGKTIYIGGQNAVNEAGQIVGQNDISLQTEQVMKNLELALKACGVDFQNLVKLTIYLMQGQNAHEAFQVSRHFLGSCKNPPIITVLFVAGLINPAYLLEIDAIAYKPEE